jgi:hypothetical protein
MLPEDVVQDEDQPARKAILSLVPFAWRFIGDSTPQ